MTIPRESENNPHTWRKMFAKGISDKGLLFKIYSYNLTIRKILDLKFSKNLNKQLSGEDMPMASKIMKRCLTSQVINKMQIKTRRSHTYILQWLMEKFNTFLKIFFVKLNLL